MDAIPYYEGDVRMIDGPSVRVHRCAATLKSPDRNIGRSRGGLAIHAVTDGNGLPVSRPYLKDQRMP